MLWASTSDEALNALRTNRERAQERVRRLRFGKRAKLLGGDYQELVREELLRIFVKPEQAARVSVTGDSSLNVFRYVTEELFHYEGAKRAFVVGTEEDPVYRDICDRLVPFDLIMGEVSIALGGLNDALLQVLPGVEQPDGSIGLPLIRVFYPHEVTVRSDPDDPGRALEVRYEEFDAEGEIQTVVWNAQQHYVAGKGGKIRYARGMTSTDNPYGRLPFVAVHAGMRSDWFWDEDTGQDRVEFTLQWLAAWSEVRHLLHQQGFFQVVHTGADHDTPPFDTMGPGTQWRVGSNQDVKVLDIHADPSAQVDTLKAMLAGHLASHGLNPERLGMNPGQAPPSGLARYLERQELLERRKRVRPFLEEAEYELADLYRFAWNWNQADRIAEGAEFRVEMREETVVLSPLEKADLRLKQIDVIERERKLGLRGEAEQIAEYNEIPLEEAERLLKERGPLETPEPEPEPAETTEEATP